MRALLLMALLAVAGSAAGEPELSDERLVLQTSLGDIELAFFPQVAPVTVAHMLELGRLGAFTTNHFFRVDRGFVAQARGCGCGAAVGVCASGPAQRARWLGARAGRCAAGAR